MRLLSIVFLAFGLLCQPAVAQNLFAPVITVNDQVITQYELTQRQKMLAALGVRGNLAEEARKGLIGDRLKVKAAADAGVTATNEQLDQAIAEFAARSDRSAAQLISMLGGQGVAQETLRDFVHANLVWQTMIRQKYAATLTVSEGEIDAALASTSEETNLQVLVSEIVLPLIEGQENQIRKLARDIANLRSFDDFETAAKQFSIAGSRVDGGKLDWISLANLPPALRPVLLPLTTGQVSDPLELPNAIALFQMRGVRETTPTSGRFTTVDYAVLTVADDEAGKGRAQLASYAETALRCEDLEGLANALPVEALVRQALPPVDIPTRTAMILAQLDTGETLIEAAAAADGSLAASLFMLCNRTSVANRDASRAEVRNRILGERLTARSNSLLESLRASARIVQK